MFKLASILLMALFLGACHSKSVVDTYMHLVLRENPQSLDPVMSQDAIAAYAIGPIYESLMQYHYLKRPYEVVTDLASEFPKYSKDGLTVTLKIKKGVHFQNDPCFPNGVGREMIADDFIFGWKRIADPKTHSEGSWIFEGRVTGFAEWKKAASDSGVADYSKPIVGFKVIDPYTIQIKLNKKYPQLNYILAMPFTSPIPHEAIEKYGVEFSRHPVGTGPYVLKEYIQNSRIVLARNPTFHGEKFPERNGGEHIPKVLPPKTAPDESEFDYGKDLPFNDGIVLHIMVERQPMWLSFLKGNIDQTEIPKDNYEASVVNGHLRPELLAKGIEMTADQSSTEWFIGFNMRDPFIGKNKLVRQAMGLAFDSQKHNELFGYSASVLANQILPATVNGFNKNFPAREFNIAKAKKLLVQAGFPDGTGIPEINYDTEGASISRQMGELFKSQMAEIGIKIKVNLHTRPEYFDVRKKGKVQIIYDGWIADYPDAENYMQLLYGPNGAPGMNNSSFKNAEYDFLYEKITNMTDSPVRQKMLDRMNVIAIENEQVWIPNWVAKIFNVHQAWLKNYLYSDFAYNVYKYYRVDFDQKKRLHK